MANELTFQANIISEHNSIIQNITGLKLSPSQDIEIIDYSFYCGNDYYHGSNPVFCPSEKGENAILGQAIDINGKIYPIDLSIMVLAYNFPYINIDSVQRCKENGEEDFSGNHAKIAFNYDICEIDSNEVANSIQYLYFYAQDLDTKNTIEQEAQSDDYIIFPNIDTSKNYAFFAKIEDNFSEQSSNIVYLSNNTPSFEVNKHTRSMGLFHQATTKNAIISGVPIKLSQDPIEDDDVITKGYFDNQTRSLTIELLASEWTNKIQSIKIDALRSEDLIFIAPLPNKENLKEYTNYKIFCIEQQQNSLIFECQSTPQNSIFVNIFIYKAKQPLSQ